MNAGLSKLLEINPMSSVRLVIKLRASRFGW
jgi:hypothetical protein